MDAGYTDGRGGWAERAEAGFGRVHCPIAAACGDWSPSSRGVMVVLMPTFVVFDTEALDATQFPPRHALVIGPDDVPVEGQVRVEDGSVSFVKPQQLSSAGVCVQVHVGVPELNGEVAMTAANVPSGPLGLLAVQSCLLPERGEAYLLTIELARHRIMSFLNKLEDWQLTDLPPENPVMVQFEEARQAFTTALVAQRGETNSGGAIVGVDPMADTASNVGLCPKADKSASQALALAINAGEGLSLIQADRQIKARLSGKQYADARAHLLRLTPEAPPANAPVILPGQGHVTLAGPPAVGCAISPGTFNEGLQRAAALSCDFVTMPMRWVDLEPREGSYSFGPTDKWIEWAVRTAKVPVVAGPVIDFRASSTPDWLYIWENDYETLRDLVIEHMQAVVTRYRRTITRWTAASGLHVNTNFKISFEQIMDLTRICVLLIRKLQPTAKVQLEVTQPWGEYHAMNRRSIPPLLYAEAVLQAGIPVDAIALRIQMGHAEPGMAARDMMALSALLDRYAALEKPIVISGLGGPSEPIAPEPYRPRAGAAAEDAYEPGYWRTGWSAQSQADWMLHAMSICLSKPYVHSVCWQELADQPEREDDAPVEMPHAGLIGRDGTPKMALSRMAQIRQAIREGRSPLGLIARGK